MGQRNELDRVESHSTEFFTACIINASTLITTVIVTSGLLLLLLLPSSLSLLRKYDWNAHSVYLNLSDIIWAFYIVAMSLLKGKAFPLQAFTGPWGSRRFRLLEFLENRHYEVGKVVNPMHRPSVPAGKIPGTHFC